VQQRVAVGRRLRGELDADDAAVFDDDGLSETCLQLLGDQARRQVGRASGLHGEYPYGLAGISLRVRSVPHGKRPHQRQHGHSEPTQPHAPLRGFRCIVLATAM
jgi:hypothetical protein